MLPPDPLTPSSLLAWVVDGDLSCGRIAGVAMSGLNEAPGCRRHSHVQEPIPRAKTQRKEMRNDVSPDVRGVRGDGFGRCASELRHEEPRVAEVRVSNAFVSPPVAGYSESVRERRMPKAVTPRLQEIELVFVVKAEWAFLQQIQSNDGQLEASVRNLWCVGNWV